MLGAVCPQVMPANFVADWRLTIVQAVVVKRIMEAVSSVSTQDFASAAACRRPFPGAGICLPKALDPELSAEGLILQLPAEMCRNVVEVSTIVFLLTAFAHAAAFISITQQRKSRPNAVPVQG